MSKTEPEPYGLRYLKSSYSLGAQSLAMILILGNRKRGLPKTLHVPLTGAVHKVLNGE